MSEDIYARVHQLELRLAASERRNSEQVLEISEQLNRMNERFNQRQDILAKELGERMDAVASRTGPE